MVFKTSKDSYDNAEGAQNYLDFLASEDGGFYRQILSEVFLSRLGEDKNQKILDLACGPGWMTWEIAKNYPNVEGCDGSRFFIEHARSKNSNAWKIKFSEADLNNPLPYPENEFDTLTISMAAHDVENQAKTFAELNRILKPGGKLMIAIPNPSFAYPVGVWKRGIIGRLLMRKPQLLVRPYFWFAKKDNNGFTYNKTLESHFYKLSDQLNHLIAVGFNLTYMSELESKDDSNNFNMQFRLHRFPTIIYLEFVKA